MDFRMNGSQGGGGYSSPSSSSMAVGPPVIPAWSAPAKRLSTYPLFADGDCLIVSPTGKKWKLHSLILAQASPVLNKVLASANPAQLTKKDREQGKNIYFKLEMVDHEMFRGSDPEGLRYKAFRAVDVAARILSIPPNANGLGEKADYNRVYDNFFRCMYNLNPEMQHDDDALSRNYIIDCTSLLQAAEYLGAIPVIRVTVEAHLLRLNQIMWHHISEKAESWIMIAAKLESPLMFRECMIHIVGKYHLKGGINKDHLQHPEHGELGAKIWDLIVAKARELKDKKMLTERNLVEFYPARIIHKEDQSTVPGRALYANDIYCWQALTLCRQFFASAILQNCHHRAADGGLAFYRTVGDGKYLSKESIHRYHETFDMSSKGRARLAESLKEIKGDLQAVVQDLLCDNSQATQSSGSDGAPIFDHLTSTEVLEEEFPWYEAPVRYENEDVNMNGQIENGEGSL